MHENAHLNRAIAGAWPPAEVVEHDGWRFRATSGVTRRANSVLVDGNPTDIVAAIEAAESFYLARGLPATFLIADPMVTPVVRQALEQRGYVPSAPTAVLGADCLDCFRQIEIDTRWEVETTAAVTNAWFDVWSAESGRSIAENETVREVFLHAPHPAAFALAADGSIAQSVGQVVVVDGVGCIQCLATRPSGRRQGAGRQVVRALIAAAVDLGATTAIAAVMVDNPASNALFAGGGFSHRYGYQYLALGDSQLVHAKPRRKATTLVPRSATA